MPIDIAQASTPSGKPYLRMLSSGEVTAADAEGLLKLVGPEGAAKGRAILAVVADGAKYSPEARQAFTRINSDAEQIPVAVVVSSAPLRVMLTFVIRMTSAAGSTKFFGAEAQALTWLDEKLAHP